MPNSNTFAVYYQSGNLRLYPNPEDLIDDKFQLVPQEFNDPTLKFVTFLSNNIINKEYPSNRNQFYT